MMRSQPRAISRLCVTIRKLVPPLWLTSRTISNTPSADLVSRLLVGQHQRRFHRQINAVEPLHTTELGGFVGKVLELTGALTEIPANAA